MNENKKLTDDAEELDDGSYSDQDEELTEEEQGTVTLKQTVDSIFNLLYISPNEFWLGESQRDYRRRRGLRTARRRYPRHPLGEFLQRRRNHPMGFG